MKNKFLPIALVLFLLAGCGNSKLPYKTPTPSTTIPQAGSSLTPSDSPSSPAAQITPTDEPATTAAITTTNAPVANDISAYGLNWIVEPSFGYEDVQPVSVMFETSNDRSNSNTIHGYRCKNFYTFKQNNKWGIMETGSGKTLVDAKYESIFELNGTRYLLPNSNDYTVADLHTSGSQTTKGQVEDFLIDDNDSESFHYYDKSANKLMYVKETTRDSREYEISEASFSDLNILLPIFSGTSEERGYTVPAYPVGCANKDGMVLECIYNKYSEIRSYDERERESLFMDGLKFMDSNQKWTYINDDNSSVLPQLFDGQFVPSQGLYNKPFQSSEGYIPVCIDGKAGYYNNNYEEVIPLIFEQTRPVYNGEAWVKMNGKWGIISLPNGK